MSPVTQYIFDGRSWQNEVTVARTTSLATTEPPFLLGITRPTSTNTGCDATLIDGTLIGDQNIRTAGTIIKNKRIEGYVIISAANVTLENCQIVGRDTSYLGYTGLVQCNSTGAFLNRCTIKPTYPRYFLNGINGSGYRAYRCNIYHVTDGLTMKGNNCIAEGCYIHDLSFFDGKNTLNGNGSEHATDTRFPGWTHNDGVQIYGYAGNKVEGCNILGYFSGSCGTYRTAMVDGCPGGSNAGRVFPLRNYAHGVFVSPNSAVLNNVIIRNNWIEGGEVCIQSSPQGRGFDAGNSVVIDGNRLGCDQKAGYTGNPVNAYTLISVVNTLGSFSVVNNTYDTTTSVPTALRGVPLASGRTYSSGMVKWDVTKA